MAPRKYALLAGAKRLALFHHDPSRDDATIDQLTAYASARATSNGHALKVCAAAEGQVISLSAPARDPSSVTLSGASALHIPALDRARTVLIAARDPSMALLLDSALQAEGLRVVKVADGETALRIARQEHPVLILLDMTLSGLDGLVVCRRMRAEHDAQAESQAACQVPILMLSGAKQHEKDVAAAFAAGATDYLITPIKSALIRSRVRAWIQRTAGN